MSRTRAIRLDPKLEKPLATLPSRSVNALVNTLLLLFFSDAAVREKVIHRDRRFSRTPLVPDKPLEDLLAPRS